MTPDYIIEAMKYRIKELKRLYCRLLEKGRHDEAEEVFSEASRLAKEVQDADTMREM